jgi:hypothetical protein
MLLRIDGGMPLRSLCAVSGCRCVGAAVALELEPAASYGGGGSDDSIVLSFKNAIIGVVKLLNPIYKI